MSQSLLPYQKDKLDLQVCATKWKEAENSLHRDTFNTGKILSRCAEQTDIKKAAVRKGRPITFHSTEKTMKMCQGSLQQTRNLTIPLEQRGKKKTTRDRYPNRPSQDKHPKGQ